MFEIQIDHDRPVYVIESHNQITVRESCARYRVRTFWTLANTFEKCIKDWINRHKRTHLHDCNSIIFLMLKVVGRTNGNCGLEQQRIELDEYMFRKVPITV